MIIRIRVFENKVGTLLSEPMKDVSDLQVIVKIEIKHLIKCLDTFERDMLRITDERWFDCTEKEL